jgi:hypothetical protein
MENEITYMGRESITQRSVSKSLVDSYGLETMFSEKGLQYKDIEERKSAIHEIKHTEPHSVTLNLGYLMSFLKIAKKYVKAGTIKITISNDEPVLLSAHGEDNDTSIKEYLAIMNDE